jgi:rhamnose utilization protein RhaD (predicted bifunctional aldolase and dehydrogenase)
MNSLWHAADAARCENALALRAYSSRLLGGDATLVLHGGGNTSMKLDEDGKRVLYVKGTGSDLSQVDERAFTPLRLDCVKQLLQQDHLDNAGMMRALDACLLRRPAPRPSIETLLHAGLPFRYVEHTHADAVLAAMNVEHIEAVHAQVYGDVAPLVPYRHSGHALARACVSVFDAQRTANTIGLILAFHGVVAFGDDARTAYERMLELVTRAESYLKAHGAWDIASTTSASTTPNTSFPDLLQAAIDAAAGTHLYRHEVSDALCLAFAQRADLAEISQQGPATPQHAVYTKRVPMITRDVEAYAVQYRNYLDTHLGPEASARIDAAPRIVLDPHVGLCALGKSANDARIASEMYRHDIAIITRASAHGRYRAAPAAAIAQAEFEYGGFAATAA